MASEFRPSERSHMASDYRGAYREPAPQTGVVFVLVVLLIGAIGLTVWLWWPAGSGLNPQAEPRPIVARGELSELEKANIAIYEQATPSLVQITNIDVQREFFGLNVQEVPKGVGSGFVWDDEGHIVTNYHVVQGARAARVTLSDKA